jgi:signal transduction histidine kinase
MFASLFKKFRGDKKIFPIVFFILFLILLSGIIAPFIIRQTKDNWNSELSEKISDIRAKSLIIYKQKEEKLLTVKKEFKAHLTNVLNPGSASYGSIIKLVSKEKYADFSVEVFAPNGRLIAWNKTVAINQDDLFPLKEPFGDVCFLRKKLITYLSVVDTLHLEGDQFFFSVSLPVEKHYSVQSPFFNEISLSKELSEKFYTSFDIDYNSFAAYARDNRKFSFEILNNKNNKIGLVTFIKPALDVTLNELNSDVSTIQSVLVISGILLLAFAFRNEFKKIKSLSYRLFILAFYFFLLRMVLYYLNFPSGILSGALVNPAYFSSAFGGGVVKSPVEFFITMLFTLLTGITAYRYIIRFIESSAITKYKKYSSFFIFLLPAVILFFWTMRGLGAAIRSVIFDSTLRYFKDPTLIPDFPSIVMNLNTLMLGTAVTALLCSFVLLLFSLLPSSGAAKAKRNFIFLFIFFQAAGIGFIYIQKQPLITPVFSLLFVSFLFTLIYHVFFLKRKSVFNYVYITLCASILTISLLSHFNLDLEREALKTTALEINRPNDNLLRFIVGETLTNAVKDENLKRIFTRENHNFNATAFRLWSHSSLQRESLNSVVTIYNSSLEPLGSFGIGVPLSLNPAGSLQLPVNNEPDVTEISLPGSPGKNYFAGILPVSDDEKVLGFVTAAVDVDVHNLISNSMPPFLESKKNILSTVLDISQLKIFEISDSGMVNISGDIYPSRDQIKPLLNLKNSAKSEFWLYSVFNQERYITYVLKTEIDGHVKLTAVSLREKHFTWNMYNFFKIFIVQSIFILFLFLTSFVFNLKKLKYSFRIQLLIAFLIISIVPVLILAVYNRQMVSQRSEAEVINELSERLRYVENNINRQAENFPDKNINDIFNTASQELGISFSVYNGSDNIYSSKKQFYDAGFFENKINPEVYYNLNYLNYREYPVKESVEKYHYDALYKRISFGGNNYIFEVNDAFNKIQATLSVLDIDIFLFGLYSFALLIIIIISTVLANKISAPIRRLTKATDSVAHGDLNVIIENNEKGEIRELLDGFNLMTKELKRNESELAALERESAWKEMAKQVAHEIKNPLTPMKLAIQQLRAAHSDQNKNFDSMFDKLSATVLNQIDNLSQIASEFSRFAKMPSLNIEVIELLPVIMDTVNLFVDEKVKITIDSPLQSSDVEADRSHLRRMIINFIRNSIQANASKIAVSVAKTGAFYEIQIEDNGTGIPEDIQHKIFDTNFTTKAKGMGIGLKLSRRFLEGINGKIELIKSSPEGTIFRISIPAILK